MTMPFFSMVLLSLASLIPVGPALASDHKFSEVAVSGTLRELADFAAEIAPLNDVRILDQLSLIYAARNFEPDRLKVIIKSHTSLDVVDEGSTSAVMHALMAGRVNNAMLLHERGASLEGVNQQGYTVRVLAEELGLEDFGPEYPAVFEAPSVDPDDASQLLLLASEAGDVSLIEWALSLDADLAAKAGNGLQAAHLAALGGHEEAFAAIVSHEAAPRRWATLRNASTGGEVFSVVDFIIAGEGGGNHQRAARMLEAAQRVPQLADQMTRQSDRYREAMTNIGYPLDVIVAAFGAPVLPDWDLGLPVFSSTDGGTGAEWRNVQRVLANKGLYTAGIDGVPGRGTLKAIVMHAAKNLPTLVERVEKMHALSQLDQSSAATVWRQLEWDGDRWQLSQSAPFDGGIVETGYSLVLPAGMDRSADLELVPMGQVYGYQSFDVVGFKNWPIEFTFGAPGREHFAYLRMSVFGRQLDAVFYEDRFTYQLQSVTRMYTAMEDVPWLSGLQVE